MIQSEICMGWEAREVIEGDWGRFLYIYICISLQNKFNNTRKVLLQFSIFYKFRHSIIFYC